MSFKLREDETEYSQKVKGNYWNADQEVRFDVSARGYVGISQWDAVTHQLTDRVLLTPEQFEALVTFVREMKPA